MPDWTYHPVLRPIGIALHKDRTREVTMGRLRGFSSNAVGRWFIRFMGHSSPDPRLAINRNGINVASPVMLGASIDPKGTATRAFDQMEFGLIESPLPHHPAEARLRAQLVARFDGDQSVERADIVRARSEQLPALREVWNGPVFVDVDEHELATGEGINFIIETDDADKIVTLRAKVGHMPVIAAGIEVETPRQALALRKAGADIVVVGEGFARSGPTLPKRIDEAILAYEFAPAESPQRTWVAGALFGFGAFCAAMLATYLALTTVLLAYDEHFSGVMIHELAGINERLPHFMSHDRLSYGGATLSAAIFYFALSAFGIRKGERWSFHALMVSGGAGFLVFFLFIPFGYLDLGNFAVVIALAIPFLIAAFKPPHFVSPGNHHDLDNDATRKRGLIGQLLFVALGVGLIIGGLLICVVGSTNVFVISDLHYLGTTAEALSEGRDRLLPLIAHDRFSFGGAIVCNGLALLLTSLWGYKRGERWIWWTVLLAGSSNLSFTFYAHFSTGYTELGHLIPVFVGSGFFVAGLVLSYGFLAGRRQELGDEQARSALSS